MACMLVVVTVSPVALMAGVGAGVAGVAPVFMVVPNVTMLAAFMVHTAPIPGRAVVARVGAAYPIAGTAVVVYRSHAHLRNLLGVPYRGIGYNASGDASLPDAVACLRGPVFEELSVPESNGRPWPGRSLENS
jgi:hypothetical protein